MEIKNIAEGWFNVIRAELNVLPDSIKTLAEERLKTCSTCPQRKNNKCTICGCPLIAKVKATKSTCPINIWKK